MDHFANLPTWVREQLAEPANGNGANGGRVSLSLANVMQSARPHRHHGRSPQRPDAGFL